MLNNNSIEPLSNHSSTNHLFKSSTYYWAPGLAVKEILPVRQLKSGTQNKMGLV